MTETPRVTEDRFLGGRIVLRQSERGYRAGIDPALLAASLDLRSGASAIELGCGPGAALLAAAVLNPETRFTGIEADPEAAALARENAAANGLADRVEIIEGDALSWRPDEKADAVFFNPPFFDDPSALRGPVPEKTAAWLTDYTLSDWIAAGSAMLKRGGALTLIHRADRLGDILTAFSAAKIGSPVIRPVSPRADKPAKRVVVRGSREGKAPLVLLPALAMHDEAGGKYSAEAEAILRGEAMLAMGA